MIGNEVGGGGRGKADSAVDVWATAIWAMSAVSQEILLAGALNRSLV